MGVETGYRSKKEKNNRKTLDEVLTPPSLQELKNLLKSNLEFCYKFSSWIFFFFFFFFSGTAKDDIASITPTGLSLNPATPPPVGTGPVSRPRGWPSLPPRRKHWWPQSRPPSPAGPPGSFPPITLVPLRDRPSRHGERLPSSPGSDSALRPQSLLPLPGRRQT